MNQAVNNLLSRDDEEGEEPEGGEGGDGYVPEDLISLLDGGFHATQQDQSVIIDADAMFSEDIFGYAAVRRYPVKLRSSSSFLKLDVALNPVQHATRLRSFRFCSVIGRYFSFSHPNFFCCVIVSLIHYITKSTRNILLCLQLILLLKQNLTLNIFLPL